ncbi:uncharacterized protein LOC143026043 [Oratosquilla oratoria]|uniref:uncharacterized protein LOC143026043 n=1 Tax=Oratosquilla oratoria TaxID=337810 RepID=UPI003F765600
MDNTVLRHEVHTSNINIPKFTRDENTLGVNKFINQIDTTISIPNEEYLAEDLKYITTSFKNHQYSKGLPGSSLRKATNIKSRQTSAEKSDRRYLVVQDSDISRTLGKTLRTSGLVVVNDMGKKIGHLVTKNTQPHSDFSFVCKISWNGCDNAYFGHTHRGLTKRLREHKADIKHHRQTNALVNHVDMEGHLPDWEKNTILAQRLHKKQRKFLIPTHS